MVKEQETKAVKDDLKKLEKTLQDERRRNEEILTSFKYLQADFENYRKRVDREIRELEEFSTVGLVRKLIPVLDDLDLAVTTAAKSADKGLLEGVKMVQKNLGSALEGEGLEEIKAVGQPFDPSSHEAVDKVEGTDNSNDMVVEEMRKGYKFKGKLPSGRPPSRSSLPRGLRRRRRKSRHELQQPSQVRSLREREDHRDRPRDDQLRSSGHGGWATHCRPERGRADGGGEDVPIRSRFHLRRAAPCGRACEATGRHEP